MPKMTVALLNETLNQQAERIASLEAEVHSLKLHLEHAKTKQTAPKPLIEFNGEQMSERKFAAQIAYRFRDCGRKEAFVEPLGNGTFQVRKVWNEPKDLSTKELLEKLQKVEDWAKAKKAETPKPAETPQQPEAEEEIELAYES